METVSLVGTAPGVLSWGPCRVQSGWSHSTPCLSFPPEPAVPPGVLHHLRVPALWWLQHSTAVPSLGISGGPNAPHTTPLTQPPADAQSDTADPAQEKKKRQEREGKAKKKTKKQQKKSLWRGRRCRRAPARRPRSSRRQRVHAPHASPDTGWTLWKFKIPDGSFWVGFFIFFPCLISKATRLAVICWLP